MGFGKDRTNNLVLKFSPQKSKLKTLMQNRVLKLSSTNNRCQSNNKVLVVGLSTLSM
jgi:hypothetical protein